MESTDVDAGGPAQNAEEIERLRQALDQEHERNLRLLADFDNLRRRVSREQEAARLDGRRAALLPLLAVVDTLERALAAGSSDQEFYGGVAATHRQFINALREAGAEPIESVGWAVDPKLHEIVGTVPSEDAEPGTVVREVRRGWRLGDDLLRPAQVIATVEEPDETWP